MRHSLGPQKFPYRIGILCNSIPYVAGHSGPGNAAICPGSLSRLLHAMVRISPPCGLSPTGSGSVEPFNLNHAKCPVLATTLIAVTRRPGKAVETPLFDLSPPVERSQGFLDAYKTEAVGVPILIWIPLPPSHEALDALIFHWPFVPACERRHCWGPPPSNTFTRCKPNASRLLNH